MILTSATFIEAFDKHEIDFETVIGNIDEESKEINHVQEEYLELVEWHNSLINIGYDKDLFDKELTNLKEEFDNRVGNLSARLNESLIKDYFQHNNSKIKDLSIVDGEIIHSWNKFCFTYDWLKIWLIKNKFDGGLPKNIQILMNNV